MIQRLGSPSPSHALLARGPLPPPQGGGEDPSPLGEREGPAAEGGGRVRGTPGAGQKVSVHGAAKVAMALKSGQTKLAELYHRDPVRVLFPRPADGDLPTATVVTVSGGLVGGDKLDYGFEARDGARFMALGQAAEKVYRSKGEDVAIDVDLKVGEDAWLEWLPQETIVFDGARMRRNTRVDLAPSARLMAGEMIVFGREAMGERTENGLIRDAWDVQVDGTPVWADALHMEGDLAEILDHPAAFDSARATATFVYAGPDAEDHLDFARETLGATPCRVGVSLVNGLLVARWVNRDTQALRKCFGRFWAAFRHHVAGLPEQLPRLWHV